MSVVPPYDFQADQTGHSERSRQDQASQRAKYHRIPFRFEWTTVCVNRYPHTRRGFKDPINPHQEQNTAYDECDSADHD